MLVDGTCPYCGEAIEVEVDESVPGTQRQVEDCWVCCRPILVIASADPDEGLSVELRREDE
jgi:hypothetical protein